MIDTKKDFAAMGRGHSVASGWIEGQWVVVWAYRLDGKTRGPHRTDWEISITWGERKFAAIIRDEFRHKAASDLIASIREGIEYYGYLT